MYLTVAECRRVVNDTLDKLGYPQLKLRMHISFNNSVRNAGTAKYHPIKNIGYITLSLPLFERTTEDGRINTIVHETCHVVASWLYKANCGHDWRWQNLMIRCGQKPEVYHNLDTV